MAGFGQRGLCPKPRAALPPCWQPGLLLLLLNIAWGLTWVQAPCLAAHELTDQAGRTVLVPDAPERVVALAPSITELVYSLGAQDCLVGRSRYSDFPPEAATLPQVGSYYRPDVERIAALRPDLCLAVLDGNPPATLEQLEKLGFPVFVLNPGSLEGMRESLKLIGHMLGRTETADRLVAEMDSRLAAVDKRVREAIAAAGGSPIVLLQVQDAPVMACAKESFPGSLVTRAGGSIPLRGNQLYPRLSAENLLTLRPEVIIVPGGSGARVGAKAHSADQIEKGDDGEKMSFPKNALEAYRQPPLCNGVPAIANGRVFALPADDMFRPSLRSLDVLEAMVGLFFPASSGATPSLAVPVNGSTAPGCQ